MCKVVSGKMPKLIFGIIGLLLLFGSWTFANVKLPKVFSDGMVLQQGIDCPIWGWADVNEAVTVVAADNKVQTTANDKGQWKVKFAPMKAGGPIELVIKGNNTITLKNVLIGEVWVCSGQSNMAMAVTSVKNGKQEAAEAIYPKIRLFKVQDTTSGVPVSDSDNLSVATWVFADANGYNIWRECNPENIVLWGAGGFSATAYFFGRELHKTLNVPIGLIDSSWGGTRIEPWTPLEGFAQVQQLDNIVKDIKRINLEYNKVVPDALIKLESWLKDAHKVAAQGGVICAPPWPVHELNNPGAPTGIYNAMINPIVPFAVRGAIWYQGESNCGDAMLYFYKMKALINGWRAVWGQGDFPFYFVQLAPWRYNAGDGLPEVWQAQLRTLSIPNTGMVVTTDLVDNVANIHPINKRDVGKRLALWALANTYAHKDIVYSGPLFKSMSIEDGAIRIRFDYVGSGLATRNGKEPDFFEVAALDMKFTKAHARIDGNTVVLSSTEVKDPVAARFAWNEEAMPNLINKEGLPASPFSTMGVSPIK